MIGVGFGDGGFIITPPPNYISVYLGMSTSGMISIVGEDTGGVGGAGGKYISFSQIFYITNLSYNYGTPVSSSLSKILLYILSHFTH